MHKLKTASYLRLRGLYILDLLRCTPIIVVN